MIMMMMMMIVVKSKQNKWGGRSARSGRASREVRWPATGLEVSMDRCTRAATRTGTEDGGDAQCEQGKVEWVNSPKPPGGEATHRGVRVSGEQGRTTNGMAGRG
jgi:hypothetical protein